MQDALSRFCFAQKLFRKTYTHKNKKCNFAGRLNSYLIFESNIQ
jgi:hypothetical protein